MSNFATIFFALPIIRCGCSPALGLRFCEFLFRDPMESSDMASQPLSDRVTPKLLLGCTDCVTVMPGEPQTGSGKTYTTGTNYTGEADRGGIFAPLMETIFRKSDAMNRHTEFLIRVSFIEKWQSLLECLFRFDKTSNGSITLAGVMEAEVKSKEDMGHMAVHLARGSLSRATESTNIHSQAR
ncbi:kinesin-like protein KIN-4C [Triticum aestivum]|uniref:kinesin-like protein KIN-4C n=1 Tax=Triticum aestivum TaxID=4565 RepID=UPI001D02AF21|nr:kinesin-like protein KIN-4C [Triticum aestivum]